MVNDAAVLAHFAAVLAHFGASVVCFFLHTTIYCRLEQEVCLTACYKSFVMHVGKGYGQTDNSLRVGGKTKHLCAKNK